jgi:hypothetical protein
VIERQHPRPEVGLVGREVDVKRAHREGLDELAILGAAGGLRDQDGVVVGVGHAETHVDGETLFEECGHQANLLKPSSAAIASRALPGGTAHIGALLFPFTCTVMWIVWPPAPGVLRRRE